MGCLPDSGKCERARAQPFIDHINATENKSYIHVSCLDIQIRDRPQPEVLYRNSQDESDIVVERKNVMWPLNYAELHSAEHHFFDFINERVHELTEGGPFALALPPTPTIDREILRAYATKISSEIESMIHRIEPGQGFVGQFNGHRFKFWHQWESEREDGEPDKGLMIEVLQRPDAAIRDPRKLPPELLAEINRIIENCVDKFQEYPHARRVLLVEPHGQLRYLGEPWWTDLLSALPPPTELDEIWVGHHEFLPGIGDDWMFEKVYAAL